MSTKKHSHYHKSVAHLDNIDVYRVCELWDVKDPSGAKQHALKKILVAGQRGAKDETKDIQEAVNTLTRWLEIRKEDQAAVVIPALK